MHRLTALAVVTVVAAVPVAAFGGRCAGSELPRNDGWTAVAAPSFGDGPSVLSGWAATAADPWTQYATNGSTVAQSTDGACSWRDVFTVAAASPATAVARSRITQVGVVAVPAGGTVAFAVVTHRPVGVLPLAASFEINVSRDGGVTWARGDSGIPQAATPVRVAFADDALHAYALVSLPRPMLREGDPDVTTVLYTTADGGGSWAAAKGSAEGSLAGFEVGARPGEVWAWDAASLLHSDDGGGTFSTVPSVTGPVTAVAVDAGSAVAFTRTALWRRVAARWVKQPVPGRVDSATVSARTGVVVGSGKSGMWVFDGARAPRRTSPVGDEYVRGLVLGARTSLPQVWGYTSGAVFHGSLTPKLGVAVPKPVRPLPSIRPVELRPGKDVLPRHPTLTPRMLDVSLAPGAARDVRYTLDLPPTPTPVDVFFLIDTTPSFDKLIAALRDQLAEIVNQLGDLRVDAQFGVGAFRDYPISSEASPLAGTSNYAYKLVRRIGPVDSSLEDALNGLRTGGGTGDGRTSALAAEYQAATGAGQSIAPVGGQDGYVIPRGLDARFRPGALRVVLLVTDTEPRRPSAGYPGPSVRQVADALGANKVRQIGLVVGEPPRGTPGPRATMEEIASITGAVATGNGIDCDADGQVDIDPDGPLVCDLVGDGLTGAIVQMLRGVRDSADVELAVTGDERVVAATSALAYDEVDVKAYNRLVFDVRYSCVGVAAGTAFPVALAARVAGRDVVRATARVRCVAPEVRRPAPPVVRIPRVAAAVLPPPPPPPVLNQIPQPNVNPNPNPNPQVNVNVQAGAVGQEQDRAQLAFADETIESREDGQLAMSGLGAAPYAVAWGCALALGCAFGVATRTRRRTALATVPVRARRT